MERVLWINIKHSGRGGGKGARGGGKRIVAQESGGGKSRI
jgi:hypothetical protein